MKIVGTIGAFFGLTAVAFGAFGAHALKDRLVEAGTLEVWKTAVDYHMWHTLALLLCANLRTGRSKFQAAAILSFIFGICLFSGSLYWLALDGPRWLGPITPLGGLSFIAGWFMLGIHWLSDAEARMTHQ